jgi:hypothetical protein
VVLLTAMLFLYPGSVPATLPAVWLGPGLAVWLLGSERSVHFGASGVVYGLAAFVLTAGVLRRDRGAVAASLVVWFLYGPMVWGVLPTRAGMSWETHLAAAVIGATWAVALRHRDVPPRRRYAWEDAAPQARRDEDEDTVEGDSDAARGHGGRGHDQRGGGARGDDCPDDDRRGGVPPAS